MGHVHARDREHEKDRGEERPEGRADGTHRLVGEGDHHEVLAAVAVGILRLEPTRERVEPRSGPEAARRRPQSAQQAEHVGARRGPDVPQGGPEVLLVEHEIHRPRGLRLGGHELPRQDSDHHAGLVVEDGGLAHDRRIGSETADRQGLVQHDDGRGRRPEGVFGEEMAQPWPHAQQGEEVLAHASAADLGGLAAAGQRGGARAGEGEPIEDPSILAHPHEVERRHPEAGEAVARHAGPHREQAFGLCKGQRPKQHGIHQAEHPGGGADSEAERRHDDQEEAGTPPEGSCRPVEIGEHGWLLDGADRAEGLKKWHCTTVYGAGYNRLHAPEL